MDGGNVLTTDILLVLIMLGGTVVLFVREWMPADVAALLILVVLGLSELVPPEGLFSGFASNAVMSIVAVMILGAGLDRTGVLGGAAKVILRVSGGHEGRLVIALSTAAGVLSIFMQNPAVAALFLPVASRVSARTGYPLSQLLMPMGFCIILGGQMSTVGNSPMILLNDLVSSINRNLPPGAGSLQYYPLFSVLPVGLGLFVIGLLYFNLFGRRLLPDEERQAVTPSRTESYFEQLYGQRGDLYELEVQAGSPLIGATVLDAEGLPGAPMLLALQDAGQARLAPPGDLQIGRGARLGVLGGRDQVEAFAAAQGCKLEPRLVQLEGLFNAARSGISEAVVPPGSRMIGKPIGELKLRRRYGVSPLAINRGGELIREDLREQEIQPGDCLVFHSTWRDLMDHAHEKDFVVITDYPKEEQRPQKLAHALTFFVLAFGLAMIGHVPVTLALFAGAAGMLMTGVLSPDEAYRAISWKTVFMLACLIPLGAAVDTTGTAAWIAQELLVVIGEWPSWGVQLAIALLTSIAALVMSNVGAAIIMIPMSVNIALAVGGNPTEYALIAACAASNNFITPTNAVTAMIAGPAGYRQADFLRAGLPLTALFAIASVALVRAFY
ncbi:MAG: SLC13 family permease [Xanthomonadales bacterium]|nr:SLC13 family permease [Xanthomonadales bacterium]